MQYSRISLKEAAKFHGHLGPYLVLGLKAGELALKKLRCKKYFGLEVKVWGATHKPKSCLIDGLQLSTGATYGKGNIEKLNGHMVKIEFFNKPDRRRIALRFKKGLINILEKTKSHKACDLFAEKLYKTDCLSLFELITHN